MDETLKESIRRFLSSIITATNEACDNAGDATKFFLRFKNATINWSDLSCHSAEFYMNEYGSFGYRIHISGADPDNRELHTFIGEELAKSGFPEVTVLTDW